MHLTVIPILCQFPGIVYWSSIILSTISLSYVDIVTHTLSPNKDKESEGEVPLLMCRYAMAPPLPAKWMAMGGVMLSASFVGWCYKIGALPKGFILFMHNLGRNSIEMITNNNRKRLSSTRRNMRTLISIGKLILISCAWFGNMAHGALTPPTNGTYTAAHSHDGTNMSAIAPNHCPLWDHKSKEPAQLARTNHCAHHRFSTSLTGRPIDARTVTSTPTSVGGVHEYIVRGSNGCDHAYPRTCRSFTSRRPLEHINDSHQPHRSRQYDSCDRRYDAPIAVAASHGQTSPPPVKQPPSILRLIQSLRSAPDNTSISRKIKEHAARNCFPTCLVSESEYTDIITLSSNQTKNDDEVRHSFDTNTVTFGVDNCATHHICSLLSLFRDHPKPITNVGVKGVAGTMPAKGIGTITFSLKDDDGVTHDITLHNVIFFPQAAQNLISVSQWSMDRRDNCSVTSRATHSTFTWGNDRFTKSIPHPPSVAIPLMKVNEDQTELALFVSANRHQFIDEHGPYLQPEEHKSESKDAKQPTIDPVSQPIINNKSDTVQPIPQPQHDHRPGDIVRCKVNKSTRICVIVSRFQTSSGEPRFRVRSLNSDSISTVTATNITTISPDPSDMPSSPANIDTQTLSQDLSQEEVKRLWSPQSDSTVSHLNRQTLYWHHRLQCAPLKTLHRLAKRGIIPRGIAKVTKMPICASCAFAAAHRRPWRHKGKKFSPIRRVTHNIPGAGTSCDHMISHQGGLMPQSTGRLTNNRFWGSVIYADHYSDFLFSFLISSTSSEETFASKLAYERVAAAHGVKIKAYHADNLRFNDSNFRKSCVTAGQQLSFCGVGAHHQNAVAEAKIKEVCYGARTILLHAKCKWSDVIDSVLWPFAVQCVVERHNRLSLDEEGLSPYEKFSNTADEIIPTDFHTWGCPVFVLDSANQSGAIRTPKWEPRAHTGVYLGHSPNHAGSVALVLHLRTGLVSPQYHLVFDDEFSTVPYLSSTTEPPNWLTLLQHSCEKTTIDKALKSRAWLYPDSLPTDQTVSEPSSLRRTTTSTKHSEITPHTTVSEGAPSAPPRESPFFASNAKRDPLSTNNQSPDTPTPNKRVSFTDSIEHGGGNTASRSNGFVDLQSAGLRRSPRLAMKRAGNTALGFLTLALSVSIQPIQQLLDHTTHCFQTRMMHYHDHLDQCFDGTTNSFNPIIQAYITSKYNNEVFTLAEMLRQPDKASFIVAMEEEVQSLFDQRIWKTVPKREMVKYYDQLRAKGKSIHRQ